MNFAEEGFQMLKKIITIIVMCSLIPMTVSADVLSTLKSRISFTGYGYENLYFALDQPVQFAEVDGDDIPDDVQKVFDEWAEKQRDALNSYSEFTQEFEISSVHKCSVVSEINDFMVGDEFKANLLIYNPDRNCIYHPDKPVIIPTETDYSIEYRMDKQIIKEVKPASRNNGSGRRSLLRWLDDFISGLIPHSN